MARRLTDTYFVECEYFYTIKQNGNESEDDGYYKFLIEVKPQDPIITALQEAICRHIKSTKNLGYDHIVESIVVAASLTKGEFTDSFLFPE